MDSAAAASKAARAAEHGSAQAVVASSQLELAAYASGTLSYLTQGSDYEALELSQHVRPHCLPNTSWMSHRQGNGPDNAPQVARGSSQDTSARCSVASTRLLLSAAL